MTYVDTMFKISDSSDSFYYLIQEDGDCLQMVELSYVEKGRPTKSVIMTTEIARTVAQKLLDMAQILEDNNK
jgi:hypothetical protein